jgi:hypothetical protein
MIPRDCEWTVRALSVVVPRTTREAWLRKWDADLWFHGLEARRKGRSESRVRWILRRRCFSMPADALWQRYDREKAVHRTMNMVRSPWFCLGVLALAVVSILLVSEGAAATRRSFFGPAFADNERIAVIRARDPIFPRMDPITPSLLDRIRTKATAFEDVAAYSFWRSWIQKGPGKFTSFAHVLVTPEFFRTLGVRAADGRAFQKEDEKGCFDCLMVTERFHRRYLNPSIPAVGQTIEFDGKKWRVTGRLPRNFWFLTSEAGAFSVLRPDSGVQRVIPVVRLRRGISPSDADRDLHWFTPRDLLEVTLVAKTLGEPVRFLGGATLLVLLGIASAAGVRIYRKRATTRYWLFFFSKCVLGLSGVFLFAMEFTGVGSLTNVVARTVGSELLAGWLWVAGTILFVWWAVIDQRRRCRTCQRRLVLPVRVGPTDRVLFDHEGTELLCPAGHGTLYVEGATETFLHGEEWRHLDDSWKDLFR